MWLKRKSHRGLAIIGSMQRAILSSWRVAGGFFYRKSEQRKFPICLFSEAAARSEGLLPLYQTMLSDKNRREIDLKKQLQVSKNKRRYLKDKEMGI